MPARRIPVVDLFAGPGGLCEGFSRAVSANGEFVFRTILSIECDEFAHRTLRLRSFYRQFPPNVVPEDYYRHLRGQLTEEQLADAFPKQWEAAAAIAFRAVLGETPAEQIDERIVRALGDTDSAWVLIGGPPCQAYSLVGRARNGKQKNARDKRHFLYREYLRILRAHKPTAFVLENVKGLLSARVKENRIVERILRDLEDAGYALHALAPNMHGLSTAQQLRPSDFIIKCEDYGIPQARHRLIIVGTRIGARIGIPPLLKPAAVRATVDDAFRGLPSLRSGLSRRESSDSGIAWAEAIRAAISNDVLAEIQKVNGGLARVIKAARDGVMRMLDSGREFLQYSTRGFRSASALWHWYCSPTLGGVCNHEARSHIGKDLGRYLFAACYAEVFSKSPTLVDFPRRLLPDHANLKDDPGHWAFADRFRVQRFGAPSTTVVSHISKDGHYYIHPDPKQCRSLTVREAARLQTFPDDYLFKGPRTEQYRQVGNAVPPLLAKQIAEALFHALSEKRATKNSHDRQPEQEASKLEYVAH